jgi:hypothetical protein
VKDDPLILDPLMQWRQAVGASAERPAASEPHDASKIQEKAANSRERRGLGTEAGLPKPDIAAIAEGANNTAERRRRIRAHHAAEAAAFAVWHERGYTWPPPTMPVLPGDLRGLPCGARTRAGTPCKRTDLCASGRCKLHGGRSTGPRTEGGRKRARSNLALRWAGRSEPEG